MMDSFVFWSGRLWWLLCNPLDWEEKCWPKKNDRKGQKIAPMANIVLCEQKSWRHFLRYIRREILHRYNIYYYIQIHTLINAKWAEADRPLLIFELNKLKHKGIVYSQNFDAKKGKKRNSICGFTRWRLFSLFQTQKFIRQIWNFYFKMAPKAFLSTKAHWSVRKYFNFVW